MCDINCMWLLNLLVAIIFIILQQQQHVFARKVEQHHFQENKYMTPYDDISPSYAAVAAAATADAAKYLHRTSMAHSVAKRAIKNAKSSDLISYVNDFNMQDETSIPEDIIDQKHLQEIIDKQQQQSIQQQEQQQQSNKNLQQTYVGANKAGSSVLNGDVDIIDVNLPYDDSTDTDSDVDIILEAQRSSERSDDNKPHNSKYNNSSNNNKDDSEEDDMVLEEINEMDKNKNNFKTKDETFKERKPLKDKADNKNKNQGKQRTKYENNIDNSNQYNTYGDVQEKHFNDPYDDTEGGEDKFELDEDDDDDGSAEYERFKSVREQRQREKQQQQQQQQEEHNEQISTQKTIVNEGTFNNQYLNEKIVNNPDNEKIKHVDDDCIDDNKDNKNINDYEIFHKHLLEERQKLLEQQQQQQQQYQQNQYKQDAIGDIEDNENSNIFKTTASNSNDGNEGKNNFVNIFIPRKMKRHNGAARLDDATNRYTRLQPDEQQEQQGKSQINTEQNHPEAVAKISSQEENFKKKYYDILKENSTSASDHYNQQHHNHHSPEESSLKDLTFYADNNDKVHEATQKTTFEKEKSLRRNSKRYGHKTHKKKYKDYLRYSQMLMLTTAPTLEQNSTKKAINTAEDDVADLSVLKDKHVKKLKLEKIKTVIPPGPIFVLKAPPEDKENKHAVMKSVEKVEKVEESTSKPFYEGQINYFLETPDDDSERANEVRFITKGERIDKNDWYRKLGPVLRNGNKKNTHATVIEERSGVGLGRSRGGYTPHHHYKGQHHGQTRNHYYHQQHHHHQQQQQGRLNHHHPASSVKHSRHHAYQRKSIPKRLVTTTTPVPPPSRTHFVNKNGIGEMGHQITDITDLDRYYAKWPHLARVQSQLHEEQMREQQSENYPDYEYDNDDYFEENDNKDDNLPPYIRKFNRRNKQLLDLLEGTIAPPTKSPQQLRWSGSKLQPGPRDSSVGSMSVHIDDDYLKEKRKRYHQRQRQIHDLFSQQRTTTTTISPTPYPYVNANVDGDEVPAEQYSSLTENHLPDEDVSISLESNEQENEFNSNRHKSGDSDGDDANNDLTAEDRETEIWQKKIETKSANMETGNLQIKNSQMEKQITITSPSTATATDAVAKMTKKSALHKLPSYPSISGGYMNRPRSRSAQFAPSSGSEYRRVSTPYLNNNNNNNDNMNNNNNNFINAGGFVAYNKAPVVSKTINGRFSANIPNDYNKQHQSVLNTTTASPVGANRQSSSSSGTNSGSSNNHLYPPSPSAPSSSVTNSFIYHRVVDASPRLVGAGFIAGRKQRLPFVAITDKRLEISKKSLTDHQKDFEQNLYPLP